MRTILKNFCGLGMAAIVTLSIPAFAQQKGAKMASLYERLGAKPAITAVVDEFVARVAADAKINRYFAAAAANPQRLAAFKGKLVDQICAASGGPCTYTGKNMKDAHAGMGITGAEFDALVGDLVGALDKFKVPEREKGELLGALGPMKTDIVGMK
jgi:hemoglobin